MKKKIEKKWVVTWTVIVIIFVAGLVTIINLLATAIHTVSGSSPQKTASKLTVVNDAKKANFVFLVPAQSPNWQFDPKSPVFDSTQDVVDYRVIMKGGNQITISQQPMPETLKPANTSSKFNQFIISSNVAFSEKVGDGTLYFRSENGGQASSAVTVIYATSNILMFGEAGSATDSKTWSGLISTMQPVSQ